ncbi:hypothetical protein [Acinetobacter pittii]|nr:hypothetical protein [Acinetobacter pittii]
MTSLLKLQLPMTKQPSQSQYAQNHAYHKSNVLSKKNQHEAKD